MRNHSDEGFIDTESHDGQHLDTHSTTEERGPPRKKRRTRGNIPRERISQACDICRARKTRCSGDRPCQYCTRKGHECTDMAVNHMNLEDDFKDRLQAIESGIDAIRQTYDVRITELENCLSFGISPSQTSHLGSNHEYANGRSYSLNTETISTHSNAAVSGYTMRVNTNQIQSFHSDRTLTAKGSTSNHQTSSNLSGLILTELSTPIEKLRLIPIPSPVTMAEAYQLFSKMYPTSDPGTNEAHGPSWVINVLLSNVDIGSCYREEDEQTLRLLSQPSPPTLDLGRATCKRYCDEYFQKINNWFPILSQERWITEYRAAKQTWFQGDTLSEALVLLTLALGVAAVGDAPTADEYPGRDYFRKGVSILGNSGPYTTSLQITHCKFLIALYFLISFQPRAAAVAISEASQQCLLLRKQLILGVYPESDREYYLRAFWCCSVLEGEISIHLKCRKSGISDDLKLKTDWPSLIDDRQSMFFLAETQIRQMQNQIDSDVCADRPLDEKNLLLSEHEHQISKWHSILPKELAFSADHIDDLFEDRTCFLRVQYHSARNLLCWPSVFAVLVAGSEDEAHELLRDQERHRRVKEYYSSLQNVLESSLELLCRKTIITWLICESLGIVMTKMIITRGSKILRTFLLANIITRLRSCVEQLAPWTFCPRISWAYHSLKSTFDEVEAAERIL